MIFPPAVSVLIVSWNSCEYTLRAIASVIEQPTLSSVEVIVVDNDSQDGSADSIAARFPDVHLIRSAHNIGFGRANNVAAQHARGRYLLLLNSDAFLDFGALDVLVAHLDSDVQAACAAPRLRYMDDRPQPSCFLFPTPVRETLAALGVDRWLLRRQAADPYDMTRWDDDRPRRVEWVMGACMLIRRDALGDEPLFDPRFFMYSEETDLCLRLHRRGYGTFCVPASTAVHVWGGSAKSVDHISLRRFYRSRAFFLEKHFGPAAASVFRTAVFVGSALRVGAASVLLKFRRDAAIEHTRTRYLALLRSRSE